jgi:hypothetical protein
MRSEPHAGNSTRSQGLATRTRSKTRYSGRLIDPQWRKFQSLVPPAPAVEFEFAADHKCDFWAQLFAASAQQDARKPNR